MTPVNILFGDLHHPVYKFFFERLDELPPNSRVERIYSGYRSFHVSLDNGDTYAWGSNDNQRLRVGFGCGGSTSVIYGCVYGSHALTIPQKMVVQYG